MSSVMLVSGSGLVRSMVAQILADLGHSVSESSSFNSATGYDICIVDIQSIEDTKMVREITVPVIILTSKGISDSHRTIHALHDGASDFILIPDSRSMPVFEDELAEKLESNLKTKVPDPSKTRIVHEFSRGKGYVIVFGASTGGPSTLSKILSALPSNLPSPVIVAQHMPDGFTEALSDRLNRDSDLEVLEAVHGEELMAGRVYISPSEVNITIDKIGDRRLINLAKGERKMNIGPCIDCLAASAAVRYMEKTIFVVLSGLGDDCVEGAEKVKQNRGYVIAQSERTCTASSMPSNVIKRNLVDAVVDADDIAIAIINRLEN